MDDENEKFTAGLANRLAEYEKQLAQEPDDPQQDRRIEQELKRQFQADLSGMN